MKSSQLVLPLLAALAFQGCAHGGKSSPEERLDRKMAAEALPKSRTDLKVAADRMIKATSKFSAKQKAELLKLRVSVSAELDRLSADSLKLRHLLLEDVFSSEYDYDEVALIKRRLKALGQKRLSVFFQAIRDANLVLGRWESKETRLRSEVLDEMTYDMLQTD